MTTLNLKPAPPPKCSICDGSITPGLAICAGCAERLARRFDR